MNPRVFIEAVGEANSGRWLIRVIRSGLSLNNVYYPDAVLREAAPKFENARVFVKSDADHIKGQGKDVRALEAGLQKVVFVEGAASDTGEIQAELVMIEPNGALNTKLREAHQRGLDALFGFSIDADGTAKTQLLEGRKVRVATSITNVNSVDLIVEPGAGGGLIRLVEAVDHGTSEESTDMALRQRMIEAIQAKNPKFVAEGATDEAIETAYREAVMAEQQPNKPAQNDQGKAHADALREIRLIEARMTAQSTIAASKLPQAAKDRLSTRFAEAKDVFTAADVSKAVEDEIAYLGKFTESGKPVIHFGEIEVEDRSKKVADMLDAFFDPTHKEHRTFGSFKECYIEITGDRNVTGRLSDCDHARMREALGNANFREAISTATFADALGDSITRRMQADYAGRTNLQTWRRVATVGRSNDFRTQERIRIGGYGNIPGVAQGADYVALTSPGDDKATFAVTKRGGLETVTLETIKNDDVGAIRRIPAELSLAAANTLYEFVFDFYRTNPTIYDGLALYHATHGNLATTALSAAEFAAHRLLMAQKVRAGSNKRMGVTPKTLLCAYENQELAYNLFIRNQNLDKTFIQTINPEVIVVPYWTDANDWVTVADPMEAPVLEISFLDGQEEPELFVQDNPSVGSLFTSDKITYKLRHIYGGGVLVDGEKYTTKAVVA